MTAPRAQQFAVSPLAQPSTRLKVAEEVITGALSFKLLTLTVIDCVVELAPSFAVTVAV